MKAKEIACANWRNKDADTAIAALVTGILDDLPKGETIGTTRLLLAVMRDADHAETKCLISHLYNARVAGKLDGYWTQGKPNGGTFGKPSVIWHAAKEKTIESRLEAFKRDDPEGYAQAQVAKKIVLPPPNVPACVVCGEAECTSEDCGWTEDQIFERVNLIVKRRTGK